MRFFNKEIETLPVEGGIVFDNYFGKKHMKKAREIFGSDIYASSNENVFKSQYARVLNKYVPKSKDIAAIIGGGDIAHMIMERMVETGNNSDLYLVDINPNQIVLEMGKFEFIRNNNFEEYQSFISGDSDIEIYGSYFNSASEKLGLDVPDFAESVKNKLKNVFLENISEGEYASLKKFVAEAYGGKRNVHFVLNSFGNFVKHKKDLEMAYVSNVPDYPAIKGLPGAGYAGGSALSLKTLKDVPRVVGMNFDGVYAKTKNENYKQLR